MKQSYGIAICVAVTIFAAFILFTIALIPPCIHIYSTVKKQCANVNAQSSACQTETDMAAHLTAI